MATPGMIITRFIKNGLLALSFCLPAHAQVGIGTTTPDGSAVLELKSSSKGLLVPRLELQSTSDAATVASPATGLLVYNTWAHNDVLPGFYYWDGSWKPLLATSGSGSYWSLTGNLASSSNFLGTTNFNPLTIKVNNQLAGRLHPNGGVALGFNASANDSNGLALGTGATATANVEAAAIGVSAIAGAYRSTAVGYGATTGANSALAAGYAASASGYQSLALGMNASATQNNTAAVGYGAVASAYQSAAFGTEATASGQSATAIGFQASAPQANSIILGSPSNTANKVGIGTSAPDERLHVNGTFKLTDGTQGDGYILVSDASGKASWKDRNANLAYGSIYYAGTGQTLNQNNNVTFGSATASKNLTIAGDGITVTRTGIYRVTYSVSFSKSGGATTDAGFQLYKDYSTAVPGSYCAVKIANNATDTLEKTVMVALTAYQKVSLRPTVSDGNTAYVSGGCSLVMELVD